MADTVDTIVLINGSKRYAARFTNISDSTGESNVVKIDKSTLVGLTGAEPTKLVIEEAKWSIQGFNYVKVTFDHTTDDEAMILSGEGTVVYSDLGGLVDPYSSGGTGDILFTTSGASTTATYDITLIVRLKG